MKHQQASLLSLALLLAFSSPCGFLVPYKAAAIPVSNSPDTMVSDGDNKFTAIPFESETQWIGLDIATDVSDILNFAKSPGTTAIVPSVILHSDDNSLEIRLQPAAYATPLATRETITDSVWSPSLYEKFASGLLQTLSLQPPAYPAPQSGGLLETLLTPEAKIIEEENQRVSKWLTSEPLNPFAHEEAALICGIMALRETSRCYYDARPALNHLTAHLVVADLARKSAPRSDAGMAAEIIELVLTGREKQASVLMNEWKDKPFPNQARYDWITALTLRNGGDWRLVSEPEKKSLLVRIEYLRSITYHSVDVKTVSFLQNEPTLEKIPDWTRIMFQNGVDVQQGHQFTQIGLKLELDELKQVLAAQGKIYNPKKIADVVNAVPGSPVINNPGELPRIQVLDDGAWGRFAQRHILHIVENTYQFYMYKWGVPERAAEFKNSMDAVVSKFVYYPLLKIYWDGKEARPAGIHITEDFIIQHMEKFPEAKAKYLMDYSPDGKKALARWFSPPEPVGSTYSADLRLLLPHYNDYIDAFWQLSPLNRDIARTFLDVHYPHNSAPMDKISETFGPLLDYDLNLVYIAAESQRKNPAQFEPLFNKIIEEEPDCYLELGDWFLNCGLDEKAAAAYQKGIDVARDRVWAANSSGWLVSYYLDHEKKEEALKISEMAAEVYSCAGLQTMIHYQERTGDLAKAEEYAMKINERYSDNLYLLALYLQHPEMPGRGNFKKEFDPVTGNFFPHGLEKVTPASFKSAPTEGIQFGENDYLEEIGIDPSAIVVALDGFRIRNEKEYTCVKSFSFSPKMEFIVWRNGRFETATAVRAWRRFGVKVTNYHL